MRRSSWFMLAYVALVGAAGPLAACAGTGSTASTGAATTTRTQTAERMGRAGRARTADRNESAQTSAPSAPAQATTYTDAQVQGFVTARSEISALPSITPAAERSTQISAILQRHSLTPATYDAIARAAQTDQALSNRIAAVSVGTTFTDAQLRSFAIASAEIDPINRTLATATPEQRQAAGAQIRDVLARNNLDLTTYNGIATRARTDTELAARIASLQPPASAPPPAG